MQKEGKLKYRDPWLQGTVFQVSLHCMNFGWCGVDRVIKKKRKKSTFEMGFHRSTSNHTVELATIPSRRPQYRNVLGIIQARKESRTAHLHDDR